MTDLDETLAILFHKRFGPGVYVVRVNVQDDSVVMQSDQIVDANGRPVPGPHHIVIDHDSVEEAVIHNAPPAKGLN